MDAIVRLTRGRLLAVARRIGNPQDAEDAVQAAYHSLLRRCHKPLDAPVLPWLLTTVVRIAYRQRAVAQRQLRVAQRLDGPGAPPAPDSLAARAEESALLRAAIAKLPARYRDVIVLRHIQGLAVPEIAGLLGAPPSTVTTRLYRARVLLRGALAPRFKHGILFLPWFVADLVRSGSPLAAASIGGIMSAKTATLATVLLIVGALGYGAGSLQAGHTPPRRADGAGTVAMLRAELEESRQRIRTLQSRLAVPRATEEVASPTVTEARAQGAPSDARARAAARDLEAPTEALDAALRAERLLRNNEEGAVEAVKNLKTYGEAGFRAVVALLRGGRNGPHFRILFEATHYPGCDALLLETMRGGELEPDSDIAAILGLGVGDSPETRAYVLERIAVETDPQAFFQLARILSGLKEPGGARSLEDKILPRTDADMERWGPYRLAILQQLGGMGGDEARRILIRYLKDEGTRRFDQIANGLAQLVQIDPDASAECARWLYARRGDTDLTPETLDALRSYGGGDEEAPRDSESPR